MSEKIARLGIERDNDLMYYIKNGDVWATPRKKPGQPKGKPQKVASAGVDLDYSSYIYFLDSDGDIARKARASGGGRKPKAAKAPKAPKAGKANGKSKKSSRSSITGHYVKPSTAKRHPDTTVEETRSHGKKSEEQIARECDEILAQTAPPAAAGAKKKSWYD
jgi:hypothetical protein